jgi:hypothetical protein
MFRNGSPETRALSMASLSALAQAKHFLGIEFSQASMKGIGLKIASSLWTDWSTASKIRSTNSLHVSRQLVWCTAIYSFLI